MQPPISVSLSTGNVAWGNNNVLADAKPRCLHAIGAGPTSSGKWFPSTVCIRPLGYSVNKFMAATFRKFPYSTVDQVVNLVAHLM